MRVAGPSRTCFFVTFDFTFFTIFAGSSSRISASSISASRILSASMTFCLEGVIVSSSSIESTISSFGSNFGFLSFLGFGIEGTFFFEGKPTSFFERPASSRRLTIMDFFPLVGKSLRMHNALSFATVKEDVCSSDITKPSQRPVVFPFQV